jgi:hypothetical protein
MAAAKPKKRKFMYPGMLMEETDSSSNESINHSDENQPQRKKKVSILREFHLLLQVLQMHTEKKENLCILVCLWKKQTPVQIVALLIQMKINHNKKKKVSILR